MTKTAGVVAIQGNVRAHEAAIRRAGREAGTPIQIRRIRRPGAVPACDLLTVPGGESTTISRGLAKTGIGEEIADHVEADKPLLATCAGLIVTASNVDDPRVEPLGVLDVTIERNAFGRQRESFEAGLEIEGLGEQFPGVFIRAPVVDSTGPGVTPLATVDGRTVAVKQGPVVGTAFHPELTESTALHRWALFDRASD